MKFQRFDAEDAGGFGADDLGNAWRRFGEGARKTGEAFGSFADEYERLRNLGRDREKTKPPPRPPRPDRGERTWANALLTAAGPELAPRVFKALAAILHPDAGGDTTLMQQLNAARDRSK